MPTLTTSSRNTIKQQTNVFNTETKHNPCNKTIANIQVNRLTTKHQLKSQLYKYLNK